MASAFPPRQRTKPMKIDTHPMSLRPVCPEPQYQIRQSQLYLPSRQWRTLRTIYIYLLFDKEGNLVIHLNGVQVWQAMPNKPDCPGNGSTYNAENLGNNATTRDTLEQKTCSTSKTNT